MGDKTTAVLGASPNRDRHSNMAVRLLTEMGYRVIPVHPTHDTIEGLKAVKSLSKISEPVHTLSLYIGSKNLPSFTEQIVALKPVRVIFNPGTENQEVKARLEAAGIQCREACTLVLLRTGRF